MSEKSKSLSLDRDIVEFQPDSIELENQQLPWLGRHGIALILLLFLAVVAWACIFEVDKIVVAQGKLIASSNNIIMKPLERVVIKKLNVEVGQTVSKGQILITFDPTFNQANVDRLQEQLNSLNAQFNRLRAEFNGKSSIENTDKTSKDDQWQNAIFSKRNQFYHEKLDYYKQNEKRLQAAHNTTSQSVLKQQERLKTLQRIEKMLEGLEKRKSVSLKQLLETQISRLQMESDVDNLKNKLIELEHEELSVNAEKNSFIQEWQKNITEEMVKTKREQSDAMQELEKANRLNALIVLRAPEDAVVLDIAQFSEGSAVREAEPLITLVPLNSKIEAEVNILPQDIGLIKIGSPVRIKLDAFPFQKHGTLDGKIRILSEDTFQDQQNTQAKQAYYRARIIVSGKLTNVPKTFRLIPGMQVTAEIKVGKRRIISYLLHPLIKALDESIREP
ncbi:MAG: HlyD family type I secretion periplasmic adaptor subunit [Victivallaceae bacterium]